MAKPKIRSSAVVALVAAALALAFGGRPLVPIETLPAVAAECNGDECEAPPPAPEDATPGTAVVEGPANPPVRFPKPHHRHHKKHRYHHKRKRHRGR